MSSRLPRVLATGVSVRSLARSAIAAGYEVLTADGYGDRDLIEPTPGPARHLTVSPFLTAVVADHVTLPYDAVAYTSSFENHPDALERLAAGRLVLGNAPAVLRDVRRPERLHDVLASAGLESPGVYAGAGEALAHAGGRDLVAKPRLSGGGSGVRRWQPADPLLESEVLQDWVDGVPGSLLFLADGRDAMPLGLTRQLIGDAAFGASGHRWCGNLLAGAGAPVFAAEPEVLASAEAAARAITRAFGLRGINGIDFIAREGTAVVIEVNPRWTAAVELVERSLGESLFPAHASGCEGELPRLGQQRRAEVIGKAVVFAPADCVMPDTDPWLADGMTADVPMSGSRVPHGAPICTIFAAATTSAACYEALTDRARAIVQSTTT